MHLFQQIEKNSITKEYTIVDNTDYQIPYLILTGYKEGKTILITAGIHGSEYTAIETAKRISKIIDLEKLCGTIAILPLVNPSAFLSRTAGLCQKTVKT